jgi:uncharacterized protein YeaO (DUF488 family)
MLKLKRAYDPPAEDDGLRYLVDRLWPRGISKVKLQLDDWLKDAAPSPELRESFCHVPERFPEFRERYLAELSESEDKVEIIKRLAFESQEGDVTLVYAAKDTQYNHAVVLAEAIAEAARAAGKT